MRITVGGKRTKETASSVRGGCEAARKVKIKNDAPNKW